VISAVDEAILGPRAADAGRCGTPMTKLRRVLVLAIAATLATFAPLAASAPTAQAASPSASATSPLISPQNDDAMLNLLMENGVEYTTSSAADDAAAYSGSDTTLVIDQDETNMSASDIAGTREVDVGPRHHPDLRPEPDQGIRPRRHRLGSHRSRSVLHLGILRPRLPRLRSAQRPRRRIRRHARRFRDLPAAERDRVADAHRRHVYEHCKPQDDNVTACYSAGGSSGPAMVSLHDNQTGGDVILLGWTDFTANEYLTQQGDAALALGLFGAHPTLVWLATQFTEDYNLNGCVGQACGYGSSSANPTSNPSGAAGGSGNGNGNGGGSSQAVTLAQLIPHWIWWMLLQLVLAAAALAYWRSRRLGRLVGEKPAGEGARRRNG